MPQVISNSRGAANNEFVVSPIVEKNIHREYREGSAFGMMSKTVKERVIKNAVGDTTVDVATSAAVWSKTITTGDEARFTLSRNLDGTPTYGDTPTKTGERLSLMHGNCFINRIDTPAIPIMADMATQRMADVWSEQVQKGEVREQVKLFFAEEDTLDGYRGFLNGSSQGLLASKAEGGIARDRGRGLSATGAGLKVSPEHVVMPGYGSLPSPKSNTATSLDNHEANILNLIKGANADIVANGGADPELYAHQNYGITRDFIQDLREYISSILKIAPTMDGGKPKWYVLCDPDLFRRLTRKGSDLWDLWETTGARGAANPIFAGYETIELDGLVFVRDAWLAKFRPDVSGSTEVIWGTDNQVAIRSFIPTSKWGLMCVLGNRALLHATNGSVKFTEEVGAHQKGWEVAANTKYGYERLRWESKDGGTDLLQQNSALIVAYAGDRTNVFEEGLSFSPAAV